MGKKRVRHSAEFKGKVALEALKWYCQFNSRLADWRDENHNTQLSPSSFSRMVKQLIQPGGIGKA